MFIPKENLALLEIVREAWFLHAFALGVMFIVVFLAMAITAQEIGISVSAVAAKMGVVFPVLFGFFWLNEHINSILTMGILASLLSVVLIARLKADHPVKGSWVALLPVLVFIGSGFIDVNLKILEHNYFSEANPHLVVSTIFTGAVFSGLIFMFVRYIRKRNPLSVRNIIGGVALGIPNYFSIYFLMKALNEPQFSTVYVMPMNNVGVVLVSVIISALLFKEVLHTKKIIGVILAIVSILLIGLS
jgi:drug/metabolite transporter (DMT)-like permease